MIKRILSLALALGLILSLTTVGTSAAFTDADAIAYPEAVEQLSALGIIGGYGDGSFAPKRTLSRGAAAKIITGMMLTAEEIAALPKDTAPYPDVPAGSTFAGYITYLKEKGVIGGYADGTFRPGNDLSSIAFLKMLMGALGYRAEAEKFYGDGGSDRIAVKAMLLGLTDGNYDFLESSGGCTREEACLYAYNALDCDMVTYNLIGKAVSTKKTYLETRFPEVAAARKTAAIADKIVNEGDQLLTVSALYCRPKDDTWVVTVTFPEDAVAGPDGLYYKSTSSVPAAPDSDTWSITIWDKEGGKKIGSYTAETNRTAPEIQNFTVPISGSAAYCGGSVYTEVVVTYVDDAGRMTSRYSHKQTFENLVDYDRRHGPINTVSLETLAAALTGSMGVEPPEHAAPANADITAYVNKVFGGEKADRLFIYDGDAIGQWLYEEYPELSAGARARADLEVEFCSPTPPVTNVCYSTMYTGAVPEVHGNSEVGVTKLVQIDTLFDAMARAGKKVALLSRTGYGVSEIFKGRNIDYFIYSTYAEINAKAAELILQDEYDVIFCYNCNYDDMMHKTGPESPESLEEMRENFRMFEVFDALIQHYWKEHDTLVTFGVDHGSHTVINRPDKPGSHGSEIALDMNVVHLFKGHPATQ